MVHQERQWTINLLDIYLSFMADNIFVVFHGRWIKIDSLFFTIFWICKKAVLQQSLEKLAFVEKWFDLVFFLFTIEDIDHVSIGYVSLATDWKFKLSIINLFTAHLLSRAKVTWRWKRWFQKSNSKIEVVDLL